MRLRDSTLERLAEMVVGDHQHFPYRSSQYITQFFERAGFPEFCHDGSTRRIWAYERLKELNQGSCSEPNLPPDGLTDVITELLDIDDFERADKERGPALQALTDLLGKYGLAVDVDGLLCTLRHVKSNVHTGTHLLKPRPLTAQEQAQRDQVARFLDSASEDDFTEKLLVPLFQRLGFTRVVACGHKEKMLEYGNDLWMKFLLPTGHWIYFGSQVKRTKLDSRGNSSDNVAEMLNQVLMLIDHPIFDPDFGREVLVDHIFLISARDITRAARSWLVRKLDAGSCQAF